MSPAETVPGAEKKKIRAFSVLWLATNHGPCTEYNVLPSQGHQELELFLAPMTLQVTQWTLASQLHWLN